jgi:hypothetical protein
VLSIKNINLLSKLLLKQIIILLCILFNGLSFSLGLGDLKVHSYLNEPLSAEIEINDIDDLILNSIVVELASPKDFILTGIPRPDYLTKIKFEIKKVNEKSIIHLFTTQVVKTSFIDFLIQVTWPDGKTIKNYTILLDPEDFKENNDNRNKKAQVNEEQTSEKLFVNQREESLSSESFADSVPESEKELLLETKQKTNKSIDPLSTEEGHTYSINKDESDPFMLNKVISSLHNFSDQANRQKINYDKLFNQSSNDLGSVKKQDPSLQPSDGMKKINSELNTEAEQSQIGNDQKDINLTATGDASLTPDVSSSLHNNLDKLNHLELIAKHVNDLLWACCLVAMIVFLFYKMIISSYHPEQFAVDTQQFNNLSYGLNYTHEPIYEPIHQPTHDIDSTKNNNTSNNTADIDNNLDLINTINFSLNSINPVVEDNKDNDLEKNFNSHVVPNPNEELELKILLAKQYLEVGDQKSAKDILQGINISKANFYKDQIISLLKSIDV